MLAVAAYAWCVGGLRLCVVYIDGRVDDRRIVADRAAGVAVACRAASSNHVRHPTSLCSLTGHGTLTLAFRLAYGHPLMMTIMTPRLLVSTCIICSVRRVVARHSCVRPTQVWLIRQRRRLDFYSAAA